MKYPLAGGVYTAISPAAASSSCTNLYAEPIEDPSDKAKGGWILVGTPGKHLYKDLTAIDSGATPYRGSICVNGRLYVVAGVKFFEINSAGNLVGSIFNVTYDAANPTATLYTNGGAQQIMIVTAGLVHIYDGFSMNVIMLPAFSGNVDTDDQVVYWSDSDPSGDKFDPSFAGQAIVINGTGYTVNQVLSPDVLTLLTSAGSQAAVAYSVASINMRTISGAVLDGYFIAAREDGTKVNISPLNDGGNNGTWIWDQLDFQNRETGPGYLRSVLAHNEQLYVFAVDGFDVWGALANPGTGFPFQRIDGAGSTIGSISRWGPIVVDGKVYYIGGSQGQIVAYVLNGFTPRRISTFGEEAAWNAGSLGTNCISSTYLEEGHWFWCIDFGFGSLAWVLDTTTGLWAQRAKFAGGIFTPYGRPYHTFCQNSHGSTNDWGVNGKHLVGGDGSGRIFEQSLFFFDDNGSDVKWQRVLPYRYSNGLRIYFKRQELELQTGTIPSGAQPVVTRDYSDDRGATFVNPDTAGMGVSNDTSKRVFWPTGGSSSNRLWRYSGTGQYKTVLVCLDADEVVGVN